ncbi:MAG: hypothetical protein DMG45_00550 [Acidobacteria bacterium]|nr:MAG: hypothetical protein DMG45_00550 [Acidobacteriota bacterium]
MLDPQVIVNLLAELGVSMNLVRRDPCIVEIFYCYAGRLGHLILCSETDEFHKQPFVWVDFQIPAEPETVLTKHFEPAASLGSNPGSNWI